MKRKARKESGRVYSKFYDPENGWYIVQYWNDWSDYRDGWRNWNNDSTKKQPKSLKTEHWGNWKGAINFSEKIKRLLNRRKLRKFKH